MAGPATRDLELYRGDDYAHELSFTNNELPPEALILTDYTFRAEIRDREENGKKVYAVFIIDDSRADEGIITLHLLPASTRIPSGYWDLEVNDGTKIQTWLKGSVTMSGDVTQGVTI